ncbi:uncharacterized protein V6R79_020824 [Siganus canaliculatus]
MDEGDSPSAVICKLCGEPFTLPESDEGDSNLPRVLLCGHIFCTSCLLSIKSDNMIRCPHCEVELTVPEGGVYEFQEDTRIIGLIYTAKINKMKSLRISRSKNCRKNRSPTCPVIRSKTKDVEQQTDIENIEKMLDEALAQAAENLAQLEHIQETLRTGMAEQTKREKLRLETEIKQATDKAQRAVQEWKDFQLNQLTQLETAFSTSQEQVGVIQERIKALEIAMQMAREILRFPSLEKYCTFDKVLDTLQAPVDHQSFNLKGITEGSGLRCVFQSENLKQSLALALKVEVGSPRHFSRSPPRGHQPGNFIRKHRTSSCSPPGHSKLPRPQRQSRESSQSSSPRPGPRCRSSFSHQSSASGLRSPDVIVEEFLIEEKKQDLPPTGPEMANDKWKSNRKPKNQIEDGRNVSQWVVVTHIVSPNHFYVSYVAEKRENEILSKKINSFCSKNSSCFTSTDTVETGCIIFTKRAEGQWCRATVVEVFQAGCAEAVEACLVEQLTSIQVFFLDYGLTKSITIPSEKRSAVSSPEALNTHLRKVSNVVNAELRRFAPQAIRCSLKDLVPYDLIKGWSEEARAEFQNVVGSAAVEMRPLGQDRDFLLVDLRKAPMDQSSDVPISVREYLVFIEVARFYSPVSPGRKPLLYYPPVYPKVNTELKAVVSHINSPADFYIQLVDNMESLLLSTKLQECYNATTAVGEDNLRVYCPVVGQAYVALYEDQLWYRAQVIGHPGGRKVRVRYIDFGNESTLSVSDLRKIKDEFFALPSMAIHCCLANVVPVVGETWSQITTSRFISMAHQKLVTIVASGSVLKSEPLPVVLFESDPNGARANMAELLVKEELACFRGGLKQKDATPGHDDSAIWDPPLEGMAMEGANGTNQKDPGEQTEDPLEFQPTLQFPAELQDLKVKVSHVSSPSSFYVQLSQCDSHLKWVCELLRQECAPTKPQDVVWKADMYCAAHNNGVWERGQICSDVTSRNIAEVMRCDHGNKVKVHVNSLRPLPSALMGSFALECTLTDIRPAGGRSTWTATACDLFSLYLTGASAVMTIKELTDERPVPVTLFCANKMGQLVSIADFLVSEGLALRERKPREAVVPQHKEPNAQSPVSETETAAETEVAPAALPPDPHASSSSTAFTPPPKPAPRTIASAEKVKTSLYQPPELPCLGHTQITVSAIGNDGVIYVRTKNAECQLEQLGERIQQRMKTLPRPKPYTWKSVQGCAVMGPDMLWYRAKLLELLGGQIKVQYVDCGLVENIPTVHVYPMLLCEDVPQLCVPCQLHGINPVGGRWQWDAVVFLKEMLLNRRADMQVLELPTDPRTHLTVELFLDGLSLNRILCHHEHASADQTVSPQQGQSASSPSGSPAFLDVWDFDTERLNEPEEPMLGPFIYPSLPQKRDQFQVRVKHLLTPNELFLWPLEGAVESEVDGETLDQALSRINKNINSLPQLSNFRQGAPCLAEYSDGRYYRAKLMDFTSVEPVTLLVQHVDFGSDDALPTRKVRQMPSELLRFPPRAVKVKVAGFKAPSVNLEENVLPYSPAWSVKAAMDMINLLHKNITASVVAEEPELTVLLYDEAGDLVHLPLVNSGLAELD